MATKLENRVAALEQQVALAVETLLSEGETGDTLVFLPGTAEIRRAIRELEPIARKYAVPKRLSVSRSSAILAASGEPDV